MTHTAPAQARLRVEVAELDRAIESDNLGDALVCLATIRREATQAEADVVAVMRARGRTWADIGGVLGITRQAAYDRWA